MVIKIKKVSEDFSDFFQRKDKILTTKYLNLRSKEPIWMSNQK